MQLNSFKEYIGKNCVIAFFIGNITKLQATNSFELSFERIGGIYIPESSNMDEGSAWKFPAFVTSTILNEIIQNTCFECGGLMKDSNACLNKIIYFEDFGNDAGQRGSTGSRHGKAQLINVRKCTSCGHSHV